MYFLSPSKEGSRFSVSSCIHRISLYMLIWHNYICAAHLSGFPPVRAYILMYSLVFVEANDKWPVHCLVFILICRWSHEEWRCWAYFKSHMLYLFFIAANNSKTFMDILESIEGHKNISFPSVTLFFLSFTSACLFFVYMSLERICPDSHSLEHEEQRFGLALSCRLSPGRFCSRASPLAEVDPWLSESLPFLFLELF